MTIRAYLALGSNIGERETHLHKAIEALHAAPGISVEKLSAVYETEPVGFVDQGAFLNMVVSVSTELKPDELLKVVLNIEQKLGRVRTIRWGPRVIDIDILLFGQEQIELPDLTVPHPAMTQRAFVLIPLRDVWEGGALPFFDRTIDEYLATAVDSKGVHKWGTIDWVTASGPSAS